MQNLSTLFSVLSQPVICVLPGHKGNRLGEFRSLHSFCSLHSPICPAYPEAF